MKRNWTAYVSIIGMMVLVFLILINRNESQIEKVPTLSAFQLDSINFEKMMKVMLEESEKKFEEQLKLQESYRKGLEAGLNEQQRSESYKRGFEEAKSIFKEDADYYRNELERFIENAGKESENNYPIPTNDSTVENEKHWGIGEVSDLYSRSMPSSEYDTIHYSDYIDNLDKRNIFLGFTSDLSLNLLDGNPAEIMSWNYIGFNFLRPSEGANYELLFGYSGNQYRLKFVAECFRIKESYRIYFTDNITWNKHHEYNSYNSSIALSLGVERKWHNSPLTIYSEIGGMINDGLSPYFELGARINFQKKIWEF